MDTTPKTGAKSVSPEPDRPSIVGAQMRPTALGLYLKRPDGMALVMPQIAASQIARSLRTEAGALDVLAEAAGPGAYREKTRAKAAFSRELADWLDGVSPSGDAVERAWRAEAPIEPVPAGEGVA